LADLNRRKDEFLAMLSHELRNPLASIVNATHLLHLQGDRNPLQIEAHGMIERQVAQLVRLVDDLLEVSRISTGRIRLNLERMDFRETIRRALESTKAQANRKGQSISISLPPEPLWVNGDSVRLEQVVVNLLNNAVKYTNRGGDIRVTVSAEADEAVLRVRDNGVGIASDMIPHIFELFAQADRSLDHAQGGLGIGLALVQSLVTMHRGRVEVESVLGEGSEFLIKLPIDEAPQVSVHCAVESVSKQFQGLKVLVVDDNVDAAQSLAMLLQAMGQETKIAHDGERAIELALGWVPDVLLLDIGLPKTNGFQVASRIRQEPTLADVMLVALMGYGQDADRQSSQEAGFNHHLTKPVEFSAIENILSSICVRKLGLSGTALADMRIN
jgi:CheY-like chemotaxis protein/two-component sensor histidine kinase